MTTPDIGQPDTLIIPARTWNILMYGRVWLARERRTRTAMRHLERRRARDLKRAPGHRQWPRRLVAISIAPEFTHPRQFREFDGAWTVAARSPSRALRRARLGSRRGSQTSARTP